MKKTIIALLALGGVACGAGVTEKIATGNVTATKSMMITSTITLSNLEKIVSTSSTNVTLLSIESGASNSWGIGVGTWTNQKLVGTSAKGGEAITNSNYTDLTWYNASGETVSTPLLNQTFTNLENAAGAAITLGYQSWKVSDDTTTTTDMTGTSVVFSVRYKDNTTVSIFGIKSTYANGGSHVPNLYYDSSLLATPSITESSTRWTIESLVAANESALPIIPAAPSIPEPTTATLSLLALAGLAARRRRR